MNAPAETPHHYRRLVTLLVRNNEFRSDNLVLEVTVQTCRDDEPISVLIREYTVENHMPSIRRKLNWVTKPVYVYEVDAEHPDDNRVISTTIDWDFRAPVDV